MKAICPHCNEQVTLDDERRGRPVRCPECDAGFRAPLQDDAEGLAPASVTIADKLMLGAAIFCGLGVLVTLAATLANRMGQTFTLPQGLPPLILLILPFIAVAISKIGRAHV